MKKKIFVILFVLLMISTAAYASYTLYEINNPQDLFNNTDSNTDEDAAPVVSSPQDDEAAAPQPSENPTSETPKETPQPEYKFSESRVNILLLGLDASTERYNTMDSFRTDVILLASIDFDNQKVSLISIPRDSYVEIPGTGKKEKINAAFKRGGSFDGKGFEKTMETVSYFLGGIPVDYYVAADMNVVKKVVDAMGGIEYNVDIPVEMCGRTLAPGFQHLNGQQVLDYARTRHTGRGDIDRVDRQQRILFAIFDKLKSSRQFTKIPEIFGIVKDNVYTNVNLKQIAALGLFAAKLDMEDLSRYTAPGGFLNINGISYWGIDQLEKQKMIEDVFGVQVDVPMEEDIHYIKSHMK